MAYGSRFPEGQGCRNISKSGELFKYLNSACDRLFNMVQGRNFGNTTSDFIAE